MSKENNKPSKKATPGCNNTTEDQSIDNVKDDICDIFTKNQTLNTCLIYLAIILILIGIIGFLYMEIEKFA